MTPIERFVYFIKEREKVRVLKEFGAPKPWTQDPILRSVKFCNVHREDDRVTRWIADNWRTPHADDPDLWFAMVGARFINWPDTLADIGYPVPWNAGVFLETMEYLAEGKTKLYTGAYMIRAGSTPGEPKYVYQEREVFTPMWQARERLRPRPGDTLNSYHILLGQFHGLGSFMAAQIVADLKYVEPLKSASDWWTFAASGPGSRRGLNRVLGRAIKSPWTEELWRLELARLIEDAQPQVMDTVGRTHAQDWQNALCEYDKFERELFGEGHARSKYDGG